MAAATSIRQSVKNRIALKVDSPNLSAWSVSLIREDRKQSSGVSRGLQPRDNELLMEPIAPYAQVLVELPRRDNYFRFLQELL